MQPHVHSQLLIARPLFTVTGWQSHKAATTTTAQRLSQPSITIVTCDNCCCWDDSSDEGEVGHGCTPFGSECALLLCGVCGSGDVARFAACGHMRTALALLSCGLLVCRGMEYHRLTGTLPPQLSTLTKLTELCVPALSCGFSWVLDGWLSSVGALIVAEMLCAQYAGTHRCMAGSIPGSG